MSDNGFIRLDRLKTALSQVKTKVDSDIAEAISESTISLTSLISSGDVNTLSEAKGYADGLKIIIDSNISSGDSSTLTNANLYTDSKISSVNLTINDLNESIPEQIDLALENYTEYNDFSDHISDTNNPHNVTAAQVGAAAISHTHSESDITDLGNYSVSGHTHTVNDITDSDILATNLNLTTHTSNTNNPHSVTYSQTGAAAASHTHELTDVTDITATATEVNYLTNSSRNIQMQLNDARMYGFFPAWEYEHEYSIGDCIRIPCCKSTQYLECIVAGISGTCPEWIIEETGGYYKLDELTSVENGQGIIDGTCVWIAQDIRDGRSVGAIDLNIWRLKYSNPLTIWYGLSLGNSNVFYSCNADKKNKMSTSEYLRYVRLIKIIISSAIMSVDMGSLRLFDLNADMRSGNSKYLQHIGGAALILDWCFRPFDYLKSENLNNIDERVFNDIIMYNNNLLLNNYNSTFGVSLTKSQIITEACACKNKIYNNTLEDDRMYLQNNSIGNRYIRFGLYGEFLNAGLPNLNASVGWLTSTGMTAQERDNELNNNKCIRWLSKSNNYEKMTTNTGNTSTYGCYDINFNASRSNSIYGNSITVQPNTITAMYCIKW